MKNLSLLNKFFFILNSIVAAMLLLSNLLPYVSPKSFPFISIFSLGVPALIIINILFVIYWILGFKKQLFLSLFVLLIGFNQLTKFYNVDGTKNLLSDDIKVMSYNVRMFNLYDWIDDKEAGNNIFTFIKDKKPDILSIQEYHSSSKNNFSYPYKYIKTRSDINRFGQAIFSNYEIINSGSLDFKKTGNNAIFADIIIKKDTIRVYNLHLQSFRILKDQENFGQENSDKLLKRFQNTFKEQEEQAEIFLAHQKKCNYKTIICSDLNNTAFSWVYKKLKESKNDAFEEAGEGFGKTFNYPYPLRIDFILADKDFKINYFKTYNEKNSDHSPIMARINLKP